MMLAATSRRAMIGTTTLCKVAQAGRTASYPLHGYGSCLALGSQTFCSSTPMPYAQRSRLSKVELAEKLSKLEKKRAVRQVRKLKEQTKREQSYVRENERKRELDEKRLVSLEIAEALEPFSDDQLDSIYRGLLAAPMGELNNPGIAAPDSALLSDPTESTMSRQARFEALGQRLAELEGRGPLENALDTAAAPSRVQQIMPITQDNAESSAKVESSSGEESLEDNESSPQQLLRRLVALSDKVDLSAHPQSEQSELASIPLGIAVLSEWKDLVLACASEGSHEQVIEALQAMQRLSLLKDGGVIAEVMGIYSDQGQTRHSLALAEHARQNSLPLSLNAHHHLLTSLTPSHPELAIKHLHSLEASGLTPLLETYTTVIRRLLSPASPPHLVQRGWDLYAHTRLVAHPTPDAALFSEMIQACSRGPYPSPERAMDLFTEMTEDNQIPPTEKAYNGVIRALTREGSQANYFEGLRLLKQMLDLNVWPTRHTFHAILEGARRHGDLPRARWILVKMVDTGGDSSPDPNTMGLVFQSYASYKPGNARQHSGRHRMNAILTSSESGTTSSSVAADDATVSSKSGSSSKSEIRPSLVLSDLLDDSSSLFYPGPLPQTSDQVLVEARNLLQRCIGPIELLQETPVDEQPAPFTAQPKFPAVFPTSFLLDSYLSVLGKHAPLDHFINFYRHAFDRADVPKTRFVFEQAIHRCETAKDREIGLEFAREVFKEWSAWDGGMNSAVDDDKLIARHLGKTGRNVSRMWGSMIRNLARSFKNAEAVDVLRRFVATYPPSLLVAQATAQAQEVAALPVQPSPIQLASAAYPETTMSSANDRPPHLLFDDLKLLHLRLVNVEDVEGLKAFRGVCNAYSGQLRIARDIEQGRRPLRANAKKKARLSARPEDQGLAERGSSLHL